MKVVKYFPKRTIDWAKKEAKRIKKELKGRKDELPKVLKKQVGKGWSYGAREAIDSGSLVRWPHEIKKNVNCSDFALGAYLITTYMGYKPVFLSVQGYRSSYDNHEEARASNGTGHSFILISPKPKKMLLYDPQMGAIGSFRIKGKSITIYDNLQTDYTKIFFDNIIELGPKQLAKRIRYLKTPEGKVDALQEEQTYSRGRWENNRLFTKYNKTRNEIIACATCSPSLGSDKLYEVITKLDKKGNVESEKLRMFVRQNLDWTSRNNRDLLAELDYSIVKNLKTKLGANLKVTDKMESSSRHTIESIILNKRKARKVIPKEKAEKAKEIKKELDVIAREQYNEFMKSEKDLLGVAAKRALYEAERKEAIKQGTDKNGFLYSEKRHDEVINCYLEKYLEVAPKRIFDDFIGAIQMKMKEDKDSILFKRRIGHNNMRANEDDMGKAKAQFRYLILFTYYYRNECAKTSDLIIHNSRTSKIIRPDMGRDKVLKALQRRNIKLYDGYRALFYENIANASIIHWICQTKEAVESYQKIIKPYLK